MKTFAAPWSKILWITSILSTILLAVIGQNMIAKGAVIYGSLPILILVIALLFVVRGFRISDDGLIVQRLLWNSKIPLTDLVEVTPFPREYVLQGSVRTWGNGGLYSFTGWFWNSELGIFRLYTNRTTQCIVLKFNDRKPIVVGPDDVEQFTWELEKIKPGIEVLGG